VDEPQLVVIADGIDALAADGHLPAPRPRLGVMVVGKHRHGGPLRIEAY
jgi:hypothetical protein